MSILFKPHKALDWTCSFSILFIHSFETFGRFGLQKNEATARDVEINPVLSFELVAYVKKIYTRASHDYSMCVLHHTFHLTPNSGLESKVNSFVATPVNPWHVLKVPSGGRL